MTDTELFKAALDARERAYAPYSHFSVGAALETADGRVFTGCNVENGSYSMTLCAERVALTSAVAAGAQNFCRLAVAGGKTREEAMCTPCAPCGACLQVLTEFCDADFPITLADDTRPLSAFLPRAFRLSCDGGLV